MAFSSSASARPSPLPTHALRVVGWCCLSFGMVYPWRRAFIDDALISLTYARTLATCGEFGPRCGVPYYGFTSPLNVVVLAGVGRITGLEAALVATSLLEMLALCFFAVRLSRRLFDRELPALGLVLLIGLNPLTISVFGMESLLGIILFLALFSALLDKASVGAGLCLGLLILVRPDLWVVSPIVLVFFWRELRWGRTLAALVAVAAPWHLYAWIKLGTMIPATLLVKRAAIAGWQNVTFLGGFRLYFTHYPALVVAAGAPALLALALPFVKNRVHRRYALAAAAIGLANYAAFAALKVPPHHWYYVPGLMAVIISGWIAVVSLGASGTRFRLGHATGLLVAAALAVGLVSFGSERGGFAEAPIHTNWMRYEGYREMGLWLKDHIPPDTTLEVVGEVGTVAYYSELPIRNELVDPWWLFDYVAREHLRESKLLALNFAFLRRPPPAPPVRNLLDVRWGQETMAGVFRVGDGTWTGDPVHFVLIPRR